MKKRKLTLKILFTSYEVAPFFKFGGLADVAGSLPKAVSKLGADIRVIMPYYLSIKQSYPNIKKIKSNIKINIAQKNFSANLYQSNLPNSKVLIYFIDLPVWFQAKNIFDKQERSRFILFPYLVSELIKNNHLSWQPDVIHCNDWQTALIPKLSKPLKIKTLFTIHNIGYAGRTNINILEKFGFEQNDFSNIKNDKVNLLEQAILNANKINTVSPTYAKEILSPEYGYDMVNALKRRKKDLSGIINGLDTAIWNPANDDKIKFKFNLQQLNKKTANKLYLQKISRLPQNKNIPIIAMVSRLAGQKGFDLIKEIFEKLMQLELQLIILGTGSEEYENFFTTMNKKYPHKFNAFLKFDIKLARQIYAGSDMFLMPSKYEPCGLGQLIAMRYGSVPIVRATGGLKDSVKKLQIINSSLPLNIKKATGFSFNKYDGQALFKTIKQALMVYQHKLIWKNLIKNDMQQDFSWDNSAKKYLELYIKLAKLKIK